MLNLIRKVWTALGSGSTEARSVRDECATLARWAARSAEDRYS